MQIKDVMTREARYIPAGTSLKDAAAEMRKLDTGFLPVKHPEEDRLQGVVTDRDIAIRGVAAGLDPDKATVDEVLSERVLYCFEGDDIETAARSMREQQVYRLVVLDGPDSKRLSGVISLGDLMRKDQTELAKKTAAAIAEAA